MPIFLGCLLPSPTNHFGNPSPPEEWRCLAKKNLEKPWCLWPIGNTGRAPLSYLLIYISILYIYIYVYIYICVHICIYIYLHEYIHIMISANNPIISLVIDQMSYPLPASTPERARHFCALSTVAVCLIVRIL